MPSELIVPSTKSIGKILLAKLGWREGKGVGARISKKVASVPIHPGADLSTISSKALAVNGSRVTFAPENSISLAAMPPPKSDFYGIGYDISVDNPELAAFKKLAYGNSDRSEGQGVYKMGDIFSGGSRAKEGGGRAKSLTSGFAMVDFSQLLKEIYSTIYFFYIRLNCNDCYELFSCDIFSFSSSHQAIYVSYTQDDDADDVYESHGISFHDYVDEIDADMDHDTPRLQLEGAVKDWLKGGKSTTGDTTAEILRQKCPSDGRYHSCGFMCLLECFF